MNKGILEQLLEDIEEIKEGIAALQRQISDDDIGRQLSFEDLTKETDEGGEKWKRVYWKERPSNLEVSNLGHVRNAHTHEPERTDVNKDGIPTVVLKYEMQGKTQYTSARLATLVIKAFKNPYLPPRSNVKHRDNDPTNCKLENLYHGSVSN